jgi:hypothetical protein
MTSVRKKHQDRVEIGSHNEGPPAATVPTQGAELPPAAATKPPEPPVESNPVDEAAKNALRDRLREMENAEGFARQAQQQPAQHIQEQEPVQDQVEAALASMPEATANWLRAHPEYINDPRKNAALQHFHWVACDETGEEYTPRYIASLERHLGLRQQPQPQPSNNGQVDRPRMEAPGLNPGVKVPPRQQQRSAPASAPPTREAPSMTTGRAPSSPVRLTTEQKDLCRALGLTEAQYAEQLQKMERLKAAGAIQDGR